MFTSTYYVQDVVTKGNGGWNESTPFPFMQGTDCCERVVSVAHGDDERTIGLRVLVRPCIRLSGWDSLKNIWMGSDFDGAFAQFVKVQASEIFPIDCGWSDVELGTIPCAYGTAENMIHRAKVAGGDLVLVSSASGGVGLAVVQLAKRRGTTVLSIAKIFPLNKIVEAQREFTEKKHVGKFVLIPPPLKDSRPI